MITNVTDAVLEDVRDWQSRPLSAVYPILYFDALFVSPSWRAEWQRLTVFFDYSPEIRTVNYTIPNDEAII